MTTTTTRFWHLPLILSLFLEGCITAAWTSSSSTTTHLGKLRMRTSHHSSIFASELHPAARLRQNRSHGSVRGRYSSCSSLHEQNDDGDGSNLEEEEFYKEYENMYALKGGANGDKENANNYNSKTEKLQALLQNKQQEQDIVPRRSTMASNNRKVELAKSWDEALIQQNIGALNITGNGIDGRTTAISDLSKLQQKIQQIQKRNKEGTVRRYSLEEHDNDEDSVPSSEWEDNNQDTKGLQGKVAEEEFESNDKYFHLLEKAQERLSTMNDSDYNSDSKNDFGKKTMISNMSSLNKRLDHINRDFNAKFDSNMESSTSRLSPSSKKPLRAKFIDDATLAEWENLDNQLEKEALKNPSKKKNRHLPIFEEGKDVSIEDEVAIPNVLRSQAAATVYDSEKTNSDMDNRRSSRNNKSLKDESDSVIPKSTPFNSDYEFTDDGGVFLTAEAYQEACNNANPDGSLNFHRDENSNDPDPQQQSSTLESAFLNDEHPMAPYGGGYSSGDEVSRKEVSIKNLTQEASRSLEYARNNPEAQEALHRRLMAEFEAEEPTNDEFENDLFLDPEKAIAFWNQEYLENQKEETDALEELLDQKMRELKKEEEGRKNDTDNINEKSYHKSDEGRLGRKIESQKYQYSDDKKIFFASREERIDLKRTIEHDRRERVKNIAKFYEGSGKNSSWENTSESKEVEEITKQQQVSSNPIGGKGDDELKNKFSSSTIQEDIQSNIHNNDSGRKMLPDKN